MKKMRFLRIPGLVILVSILTLNLPGSAQDIPDQATLKAHAPKMFRVLFTTTKGDFTLEVRREWSPAGADRLWQLVTTGFYTQNSLFRVQKGYVVQFGISDRKDVNYFWDRRPIPDEEVRTSNRRGTVAYARDGMNSRTAQLFINLKDNPKLDTVNFNGLRGFSPVGEITEGFSTIEALNGEYGFEPANHQDSVMTLGNRYLKIKFPGLDYILNARILE